MDIPIVGLSADVYLLQTVTYGWQSEIEVSRLLGLEVELDECVAVTDVLEEDFDVSIFRDVHREFTVIVGYGL